MESIYAERIKALRSLMRERGWDIVILTGSDPHSSEYPALRWKQVEWLSGFTGEAGDVVVTADHAGLWTDTRYFIQAVRQLEGSGIVLHKMRVPEQVPIPQWIASLGMDEPVIAVDGLCQSVQAVDTLKAAVPSAVIEAVPDLLSVLWAGRPAIPATPIITLGADLTGEDRETRLTWLRKYLIKNGLDAILITALDEVAWLLNVRGGDVDYNPVVISYLLVTLDTVSWFVRKDSFSSLDSETESTFAEVAADGIQIRDYDDVEFALSSLKVDGVDRVQMDPSTLNIRLREAVDEGDGVPEVVYAPSPVALRKAVKNEVEISGMKEAHLEDGLIMEQFLWWIQQHAGEVDEWQAACYLGSLRAQIPGYRGDSFETISGYGPGAALPHYSTPHEGSALLERHGLYLCDSGGQYLFGTTDITRTVPLGPCTALEKEDYTLVMKGHIDLAMAIFPRGTTGCHLDILAREPLWRAKRNFGHGTGHGIGFYLNVHEGPHEFRQNFNDVAFRPGMVVTIEPGLYREGMHGVRHENAYYCRSIGDNEFGSWLAFEPFTLCHFDTSVLLTDMLTEDEKNWLNAYNERVFRTLSPRLPAEIVPWLREKTLPV